MFISFTKLLPAFWFAGGTACVVVRRLDDTAAERWNELAEISILLVD
jgi:hypothetical protein